MVRMLVSIAIALAANAIGLAVAAVVLEDMTINGPSFVIAVAIFTLASLILAPLFTSMALKTAQFMRGATALVTTFAGLVITTLISDGLSINGISTWISATVIVWLAAMLAALVLPLIFVKKAVANNQTQ